MISSATKKVFYSCVIDGDPKFLRQGLTLVYSLIGVGVDPDRIIVNLTPRARGYREVFESLGCRAADSAFFADGKYCNKVSQLRNAPANCDFIVCCDADIFFMRNIEDEIVANGRCVQGKPVDYDNPPAEIFERLLNHLGRSGLKCEARADINGAPTLPANFNGGLYILPGEAIEKFRTKWEENAINLYFDETVQQILDSFAWHIDQISFCLSVHDLELEFTELSLGFNYPLHFKVPAHLDIAPDDLRIVHYHTAFDENGLPDPKFVARNDLRGAILAGCETVRMLHFLKATQAAGGRDPEMNLIVGFHRSGTSLLSAAVSAIGVSEGMGDLLGASFDNPKGYYENRSFVKLNEAMMRFLESEWDDIFYSHRGAGEDILNKFYLKMEEFLNTEFPSSSGAQYFLKDPRVMMTYPVWRNIFAQAGIGEPRIIYVLRNPVECANSQQARHKKAFIERNDPFHYFGREPRETLLLWYQYTIRFLLSLQGEQVYGVDFEAFHNEPEACLTGLADWLGVEFDAIRAGDFMSDFMDASLRHHEADDQALLDGCQDLTPIAELYFDLRRLLGRTHGKGPLAISDLRALATRHADLSRNLVKYDFLGRLASVPKLAWARAVHTG